jgi:hypothetical protein
MGVFQKRFFGGLCALGCAITSGSGYAQASAPPVIADGQVVLASGLGSPQGIAASHSGTIYVADTGNNRVVAIPSSGVVTPVNTGTYTLNNLPRWQWMDPETSI